MAVEINYINHSWKKLSESTDITERVQFNPKKQDEIQEYFNAPETKRIVLVHPVRNAVGEEPKFIQDLFADAKKNDEKIYIPRTYNYQEDLFSGIMICNTMRHVIENCGKVAIGYDPSSEGSKVDIGMTLYTTESGMHMGYFSPIKIKLLNRDMNIEDKLYDYLHFADFDENYESRNQKNVNTMDNFVQSQVENTFYNDKIMLTLQYTPRKSPDGKELPPMLSTESALIFGMVYASKRPFVILNIDEVKNQSALEDKAGFIKSYSKVALRLDQIYNPWR